MQDASASTPDHNLLVVGQRIVAEHTEFEMVLPELLAVATSGVATGLGDDLAVILGKQTAIDVIDEAGAAQHLVAASKRRKTIGTKEVEAVVAKIARIPPKPVSKDDVEVRKDLESSLKRVVFGQADAIVALSSAINLSRVLANRSLPKRAGCRPDIRPVRLGTQTAPEE